MSTNGIILFACKQMQLLVYQTTEHHRDFLQIVYTKKGTCYFCSSRKKKYLLWTSWRKRKARQENTVTRFSGTVCGFGIEKAPGDWRHWKEKVRLRFLCDCFDLFLYYWHGLKVRKSCCKNISTKIKTGIGNAFFWCSIQFFFLIPDEMW